MIELLHGDCLERLKELPDCSVDACVTDPPYGLSFMGKAWDYDVPGAEVWREVLRVLKPGGHLLAFAGTRTQHRMAVQIEDAGFEIRDMIAWVYGSGFPKSLDVSKAIDKAGGNPLAWRAFSEAYAAAVQASAFKHSDIDRALGIKSSSCYWARTDHRGGMPPCHHWEAVRELLGLSADFERLYDEAEREVVGQRTTGIGTGKGSTPIMGDGSRDITAPATPAAQQWAGWGTALKPALEPITVARKPFKGTVAANVLEHGTGAINVDGCRVAGVKGVPASPSNAGSLGWSTGGDMDRKQQQNGRWPANLIHDGSDEPCALLSDAARFFYCAKASKADRNSGLDGCEIISIEPIDLEASSKWGKEDLPVRLLVDTARSPQRVIAAFGAQIRSAPEWSTLLFGSASTAPFRSDLTFITKTATSSTTQSTTLNCFLGLLTNESTQAASFGQTGGGSRAVNAKAGTTSITITAEKMASVLGAELAASATQWQISAAAWTSIHPTVKPTDLMRYLCRLVTPPGGVVLDPFMGSGSTGKAAALEGFQFIGIEREAEYLEIARGRIQLPEQGALL
jgi:hypothetical protein